METRDPSDTQPKLVLGIDTGGTYTDGVLLDYESRKVLSAHKSLTTKRDFAIGIDDVIAKIHIEDPSSIRMVSISTTLATNAIAEGKGKRVGLFLIGYDPDLISSFKMETRFATPHFFYFDGGHDLYGTEKQELDLPGILSKVNEMKNHIDALAVSSYFSPLNPEHELRAQKAIQSVCDLPVVLGHQLSTKLGSVERATTAALNASLLAVLQEFIIAVRRAMENRGIEAPLMVVRGDGTLMSDEFAARSPVETIHSGPAASAIGGRFISGVDDALVVDIGGTTTDLALVEGGEVAISEEGASVSGYKTSVKAANLLSIGLGGDSHVTIDRDGKIKIGPERVVPLAYLANQYPQVLRQLKTLTRRDWSHSSPDRLEYWFVLRKPRDKGSLTSSRQQALLDVLEEVPQPVADIVKRLGVLHLAQLDASELITQEIIGKAGLTPTDLLHVEGRYTPWSVEASKYAWEVFSRHLFKDPHELCQDIWLQMKEIIVRATVSFLSGKTLYPEPVSLDDAGYWFFHNSLYQEHPYLETSFRLRDPLIGIGAPAGIFLQEVAQALNTDLILPEYHQVANAIGAVSGSVMVQEEVLIYPRLSGDGLDVVGYFVQVGEGRQQFEDLQESLGYARKISRERALGAALRSGADNPQVTLSEINDGLDTFRIRAQAMGNPRLTK